MTIEFSVSVHQIRVCRFWICARSIDMLRYAVMQNINPLRALNFRRDGVYTSSYFFLKYLGWTGALNKVDHSNLSPVFSKSGLAGFTRMPRIPQGYFNKSGELELEDMPSPPATYICEMDSKDAFEAREMEPIEVYHIALTWRSRLKQEGIEMD